MSFWQRSRGWRCSITAQRIKYSSGEGYQTAHRCSLSRQLSFPDNYLFERYHFTSQSIIYIHNLIRPYICNITKALTSQQILCVALRFFANGSFLWRCRALEQGNCMQGSQKSVPRHETAFTPCLSFSLDINLSEPSRRSWGVDSGDELPPGIPSATGLPIYWLPPLEVTVLGHHPFYGHLPSFCWLSNLC